MASKNAEIKKGVKNRKRVIKKGSNRIIETEVDVGYSCNTIIRFDPFFEPFLDPQRFVSASASSSISSNASRS